MLGKAQYFMTLLLVFAPSSGFIVSKIGNLKPIIAGTIIMTALEFVVALNLAILAIGISLI
jgi:hypothetical protein